MVALSLDESHVTEVNDPRDRPKGLFLTYHIHDGGGRPLYGNADQQYLTVEDDPEDANGYLLGYDNASIIRMTIGIHAPADRYTDLRIRELARIAQRHAISTTNRELNLLGLDARIIDPGRIRDGTTVLNQDVERVAKFELSIVVGESFSVSVGKFDTFTLSLEEGMEDAEGENPTREEKVIT